MIGFIAVINGSLKIHLCLLDMIIWYKLLVASIVTPEAGMPALYMLVIDALSTQSTICS